MESGPSREENDLAGALELESLQIQLADAESNIEELTQQQNNLLVQIAAENESTFEEQNTAVRTESKVEKENGEQQNTSVLILGGDGPLNIICLLDSKAQSWKELSITLPMRMESFGAAVVNEEIYIFGGYAANGYQQQNCYKLKDDGTWIKLASLNEKRVSISSSSLVYKGDIWIIGGEFGDSGEPLNSVEKYDISQDKWTYMPLVLFQLLKGHSLELVILSDFCSYSNCGGPKSATKFGSILL